MSLLEEKGLLRGKSVAIDATTLEANAAMKSIVRKDTGQDWKEYLRGLAKAEGIENPTEEDLRRLDRGRKDKKVSNQQWESPTDRDSRIAKMKDGRTHLAYKAEHAVDLESEAIVATTVTFADKSDPQSGPVTLSLAEANLVLAGSATEIEETVMDKGYHDNGLLAGLARAGRANVYPGAAAEEPVLDGQTDRTGRGLSSQSPASAREEGTAVEPVAERTVRTNLCPCVRDRRRPADMAAGTDQCQQNAYAQMRGV